MKTKSLVVATLLAGVLWLQACTVPSWVPTAESIAETAVPIAGSIVDIVDPNLAPTVNVVETSFTALTKTLDTYKASPTATTLQAVESAFAAVNTNVATLASAAQIKNPTTSAEVVGIVGLLTQAVTEIAALVPPAQANAMGVAAPTGEVKHWSARDFRKHFNAIAKTDPRLKPLK